MKPGDKVIVTQPMEVLSTQGDAVMVQRVGVALQYIDWRSELTVVIGDQLELTGVVIDGECVVEASFKIDAAKNKGRHVRLIAYVLPQHPAESAEEQVK